MRTSSCKAKGRRLAVEVRDMMHKYAPDLKPGDIEVTSSSVCGEDLKLSPAAQEKFPIIIECKNRETINIWEALAQAEDHLKHPKKDEVVSWYELGFRVPVVFFRRNRSKTYVTLPAEDFLKLIT